MKKELQKIVVKFDAPEAKKADTLKFNIGDVLTFQVVRTAVKGIPHERCTLPIVGAFRGAPTVYLDGFGECVIYHNEIINIQPQAKG